MSYEAGSKECRRLIEAKESLLSAMESLSNINDVLQIQIKDIYNKLEIMHDRRKKLNLPQIIFRNIKNNFKDFKLSYSFLTLFYSFLTIMYEEHPTEPELLWLRLNRVINHPL